MGGQSLRLHPDTLLSHIQSRACTNTRDRHDRVAHLKGWKESGERESSNMYPAGRTDKGFF